VWLLVIDRFGRTVGKPDLSRAVGRPRSGFGSRATHREGRMASHPRFSTLLLSYFWWCAPWLLEWALRASVCQERGIEVISGVRITGLTGSG